MHLVNSSPPPKPDVNSNGIKGPVTICNPAASNKPAAPSYRVNRQTSTTASCMVIRETSTAISSDKPGRPWWAHNLTPHEDRMYLAGELDKHLGAPEPKLNKLPAAPTTTFDPYTVVRYTPTTRGYAPRKGYSHADYFGGVRPQAQMKADGTESTDVDHPR